MRVALLRGINVGGHNVTGVVLREVFDAIGLRGARVFLASGNVLFDEPVTPGADVAPPWPGSTCAAVRPASPGRADPHGVAALEDRIAAALEGRLGWPVPTFIRSATELAAVLAHPSTTELAAPDGGTLVVGFWHRPPAPGERARVEALAGADDELRVVGRELYWLSRGPLHRSKITGARLERATGGPLTCRNIKTVHRLLALAEA